MYKGLWFKVEDESKPWLALLPLLLMLEGSEEPISLFSCC
jgi:hypothetical protein